MFPLYIQKLKLPIVHAETEVTYLLMSFTQPVRDPISKESKVQPRSV